MTTIKTEFTFTKWADDVEYKYQTRALAYDKDGFLTFVVFLEGGWYAEGPYCCGHCEEVDVDYYCVV